MSRDQQIARLLRAVTELSQEEFARKADLPANLVAQIEAGRIEPRQPHLQKMARRVVGITLSDADEVLRHLETLRKYRNRQETGTAEVLHIWEDRLKRDLAKVYYHLLALPGPVHVPQAEERLKAHALLEQLRALPSEVRFSLVKVAEDFQTWALCAAVCEESISEAAKSTERSMSWAQLAQEIASHVNVSEPFHKRVRAYAGLHLANALRIVGDLPASEMSFDRAEQLWFAGSDPEELLDPGRLLDIKACLRRAQRRFEEALLLLDQAIEASHSPIRAWMNKGLTLEVMGEYEQAVDAFLLAAALLDEGKEPRLHDILYLNLANNFCHLGQHRNAADLVRKVQPRVANRGDEIDLIRILWLQGRIEAGLGRTDEALNLLAEARERFATEKMLYDVALALLEEAVLLLGQGRIAEVKALAQELAAVFDQQGVHREALAALRLFHEATQREKATAELARDVLRFLFRARHDQGLRFEAP